MSKSCNYIQENIQNVSGYGFLCHPGWEDEVEKWANRLASMIAVSIDEEKYDLEYWTQHERW